MTANTPAPQSAQGYTRDILRLAIPAYVTLVAEPLFLLADSAIIGHLGTSSLAGVGIAGAILSTAAGLFVFLAYSTTAVVARTLGAAGTRHALGAGLDGIWLAAALGILSCAVVGLGAAPLAAAFGPSPEVLSHAITYLRISALGLPAMLLTLATTGILRGLQDTRTPLLVTTFGFTANIALNVWFVLGLHLGVAGSAWGTVIAQNSMALALLAVVARAAHHHRAPRRPHLRGILTAAVDGVPLLVRTLALRTILLLTTWAAAALGDIPLAAYQVSATIWTFLTFSLDALAIAGQSLTGHALGRGDTAAARTMTTMMTRWGTWCGVALGVLLLPLHTVLPVLFTPDQGVRDALAMALLVVALGQPISGYVFVLDGVLIGAGDARWLALAQVWLLVAYAPLAVAVHVCADQLTSTGPGIAVMVLWGAFQIFMGLRAVALGRRARTDSWMTVGAA
ncbi:MATE family efflux transporter [Austwickia sp. TVS 96-490-7B]|uniref:MATE family efflux transporter n=1 Tax=Austwickia sp. TVS 96-490-7B TaxID=2830843 RepID=UPI0021071B0A|nr:MATE family efflux transporter [Austwickia sp. TVS 96-490-7B]